jgi:glutamate--cysteine ligase
MVPHLITALTGPINELEQRISDATPVIERWFRLEWMEHTPPLYCSVDIRNAGFKLAPVDTNLFPGGWHNLSPDMLPLAVQAAHGGDREDLPRGAQPADRARERQAVSFTWPAWRAWPRSSAWRG